MRKAVPILLLACLLASTATAAVVAQRGDGKLSVSDGRGEVWLQARGVLIGRIDKGSVTITDLSPLDDTEPLVWGAEKEQFRGSATVFRGEDIRFRLIGGQWRILVKGSGIDISAAARGTVTLEGEGQRTGVYSTTGVDCRTNEARCLPLPLDEARLQLGATTD
jgi:hypothetical protein